MLMRMFARPFRPEDETEADRDGAAWAYRAGYDPREMAELFLRLHRRDKGQAVAMPAFFRTHPFNLDRHKNLMKQYRQLRRAEPKKELYVSRKNLLRRVARSRRRFPE